MTLTTVIMCLEISWTTVTRNTSKLFLRWRIQMQTCGTVAMEHRIHILRPQQLNLVSPSRITRLIVTTDRHPKSSQRKTARKSHQHRSIPGMRRHNSNRCKGILLIMSVILISRTRNSTVPGRFHRNHSISIKNQWYTQRLSMSSDLRTRDQSRIHVPAHQTAGVHTQSLCNHELRWTCNWEKSSTKWNKFCVRTIQISLHSVNRRLHYRISWMMTESRRRSKTSNFQTNLNHLRTKSMSAWRSRSM